MYWGGFQCGEISREKDELYETFGYHETFFRGY